MRIVSLVPSLTEFLFDLGLEEEVVGITKFCLHPNKWFRTKTRIGGTKTPHIDRILELNPTLIVANKEENRREDVEALRKHCNVWVSDINNLAQMEKELLYLSELVNRLQQGKQVLLKILAELEAAQPLSEKRTCAYLIWNNPIMTAGHSTFITEMLGKFNLFNSCLTLNKNSRYPEVSEQELIDLNPEVLMLSSEPYPFKAEQLIHFQKLLPKSKTLLVDGELFSWYGSRLKYFNSHWQTLLHTLKN